MFIYKVPQIDEFTGLSTLADVVDTAIQRDPKNLSLITELFEQLASYTRVIATETALRKTYNKWNGKINDIHIFWLPDPLKFKVVPGILWKEGQDERSFIFICSPFELCWLARGYRVYPPIK